MSLTTQLGNHGSDISRAGDADQSETREGVGLPCFQDQVELVVSVDDEPVCIMPLNQQLKSRRSELF